MSQVWGSSVNQNTNTWTVGLSHTCFCTVRWCRQWMLKISCKCYNRFHFVSHFQRSKNMNTKSLMLLCTQKMVLSYPVDLFFLVAPKVLEGSNRLDWQLEIIFGNCLFKLLEIPCIICWIFPCIGGNCDQTTNAFCPIIKIVIISIEHALGNPEPFLLPRKRSLSCANSIYVFHC